MSVKENGNKNQQSAKVLQLGFNISVTGDPGTDFQIVLDDKGQGVQSSTQNKLQSSESSQNSDEKKMLLYEIEDMDSEKKSAESTGAVRKHNRSSRSTTPSSTSKPSEERTESTTSKDLSLINEIQSTMDHFEKFSDKIKEIPRLKTRPLAASTPLLDKQNSRSESSLTYSDYRPRRFSHLYDFHSRKDYFRGSVKPPDLFLKPLPGESYYKRGIVTRYYDVEPYRHYGSFDSLNNQSKFEIEKYETEDVPHGILKKSDSESGDKQSTSSADSVKDIKIYQSGGILIMQNFKDNLDAVDKKEISEFSAKLIENCNKLKEEVGTLGNVDEKVAGAGNSSDELKKVVQFDLSGFENQKPDNACKDDSKLESSESTSDCLKIKENSPQGTSQSQDFASLSTQENDSIVSNQPGMSPTFGASSKKLEWDSGADVGYLNLDLSKENLSTIERIVLKGLSSDGLSEKKVVFEKKTDHHTNRSKFILERMPSELVIEETTEDKAKSEKETSEAPPKSEECNVETFKEVSKDKIKAEVEETKKSKLQDTFLPKEDTNNKESSKGFQIKKSIDKSINVNTLYEELDSYIQNIRQNEPTKLKSRSSPKVKKIKKKKSLSQRSNLSVPLIGQCSEKTEKPSIEMGVPKRVQRNLEAKPELNEVELSREVEEIIIDQRFKIKQNVGVSKEKSTEVDCKKETKTKGRPVSASSSSNNTVLRKEDDGTKEVNKYMDQIVQTTEAKVESIGVQAFASQKSSVHDIKSLPRDKPLEVLKIAKPEKESVNMISKNVQAFGLNSSLPKQLAHPRETNFNDSQNTKSTQFFGGPINSLPNYHTSLITKPVESCGRMPKVLKTRKNMQTEMIRLKEQNEKNIMVNDDVKDSDQKQNLKLVTEDIENKENVITEKSTNSKKSQSESSKKSSKLYHKERNDSDGFKSKDKTYRETVSIGTSECFETSNDESNKILTSEVLKEHGDSIDRNIIKEKYFQSQLAEIEKREMKSKSTSMERPFAGDEANGSRECATVGCQYSPKEESSREIENSFPKDKKVKRKEKSASSNNLEENSTNQEFGSLPSSTQTANSWIPGMPDSDSNNKSGVGRARSFEYLPGHIYESSGNLREELPSDVDQHVLTCSSAGSSELEAAGQSISEDAKDSEGRTTLVLENSSESSQDSRPMKLLDENLTQLNMVVSKLWEKDAQIQSITQSLLVNLWKRNGSGDHSQGLGAIDIQKTEVLDKKDSTDDGVSRGGSGDSKKGDLAKKNKENEISIGCQTEGKSPVSDGERFYQERKALEKRIHEEKESQIKWIENEIYHLNILRGLLEKQNYSSLKKKQSSSPTSGDTYRKNAVVEVHPAPVTPVYGCTISLLDSKSPLEKPQSSEEKSPTVSAADSENIADESEGLKYGMAVSLSEGPKNLRQVVMLPVGVQVTLKNKDFTEKCVNEVPNRASAFLQKSCQCSPTSDIPCRHYRVLQSDINTQYPSLRKVPRHYASVSAQTNFPSTRRCSLCRQENCVCLDLSRTSNETVSRSSRHDRKTSAMRENHKLSFANNVENNSRSTTNSIDPDIFETDSCPVTKAKDIVEKVSDNKSDTSSSFVKSKAVQNSTCKCINCPRKVASPGNRSSCRGPCQSNIYLNCEKSFEDGSCRCSKVQVKKSSTCTCHIIKIHGSKCCSAESGTCSCKKRSAVKKTENQSCQTEDFTVVVKELVTNNVDILSPTKAPGVVYPCEAKIAVERKKPINEKIPAEPKTVCENKTPCDAKLEVQEKSALEKNNEEVEEEAPVKPCKCQEKSKKEKNDHPRHYFLKIEEKEVDELNESIERRRSLEVITVTVPVKKTGKAKLYGKPVRSEQSNTCSLESCYGFPNIGCNCCDKCLSRLCKKVTQECKRLEAEKPQSPKKHNSQGYSCEDVCREGNSYHYLAQNYRSSSSQDCYQNKDSIEYVRSELYCTPSRESEYDSHKKGRSHRNEDLKASKISKAQKNEQSFDCDYYNYNKKEYMTKSELEKEKKMRSYQPSLQECLASNRPDFYCSAESRRQIISDRARERVKKHNNRMECLINLIHHCDGSDQSRGPKRIFTTSQMREQTLRRYKKLPEVTGKIADLKKKEEYRTNKLMADIFAKKLQIEALKGHINLSNSISILSTI